MNKILQVRQLNNTVFEYVIEAKNVTVNAKPGQFIILRVTEDGERIPFTICDMNKENGTVTILVQVVGYSTTLLSQKKSGDFIADFVGPLGHPTDIREYKNIVMIGGGIGAAVIFPQAKLRKLEGQPADIILGARNKEFILYENEFLNNSQNLYITTDDGSYKNKGNVTDVLKDLLDNQNKSYDLVFAVGPMPMMRAVCMLTKEYNIKTIVSMNATMVDGTGMCGGCRLTFDGKVKYACVDGPEFDGHLINWDDAINRSKNFASSENRHNCRIR